MARLPTPADLGTVQPQSAYGAARAPDTAGEIARTGEVIAGHWTGRGGIVSSLDRVGDMGRQLTEAGMKGAAADYDRKMFEFEAEQERIYNALRDTVPLSQLDNFENFIAEKFTEQAKQSGIYDNAPSFLKGSIEGKLLESRERLRNRALEYARPARSKYAFEQRKTYHEGALQSRIATANSTSEIEDMVAEQIESINNDPTMLPDDKYVAIDNLYTAAATGAFEALPPDEKAKLAKLIQEERAATMKATPEQVLFMKESGRRFDAKNEYGFAGRGQFGAPRLAELGFYKPHSKEALEGWQRRLESEDPYKWKGQFRINGKTLTFDQFLADPEAQKFVEKAHFADIKAKMERDGLDKYIGQTVGGVVITESGILNMAHLGGYAGAKRFLETGGAYNPADSNRTRLAAYARMGADAEMGGTFSAIFSKISNTDLEDIIKTGEAEGLVDRAYAYYSELRSANTDEDGNTDFNAIRDAIHEVAREDGDLAKAMEQALNSDAETKREADAAAKKKQNDTAYAAILKAESAPPEGRASAYAEAAGAIAAVKDPETREALDKRAKSGPPIDGNTSEFNKIQTIFYNEGAAAVKKYLEENPGAPLVLSETQLSKVYDMAKSNETENSRTISRGALIKEYLKSAGFSKKQRDKLFEKAVALVEKNLNVAKEANDGKNISQEDEALLIARTFTEFNSDAGYSIWSDWFTGRTTLDELVTYADGIDEAANQPPGTAWNIAVKYANQNRLPGKMVTMEDIYKILAATKESL